MTVSDPTSDPTPEPVDLRDYAALLRRRWWVLALATVIGLGAAGAWTAYQPRVYTAVTDVLVTATGVEDDAVTTSARTRAEINLDTEAQLLKSTAVLGLVREQLGSELTVDQLADRISVSVPPNTEVLTIGFEAGTPQAALDGAVATATAYLANRAQEAADNVAARQTARQAQIDSLTVSLQEVTASLAGLREGSAERSLAEAQVQSISAQIAVLISESNELDSFAPTPGKVITEATLPRSPSSPVLPMNLAGGAMLGLLVGCAVALWLQHRDRRVRDAESVTKQTNIPVLVTMPATDSLDVADRDGPEGRAYVRLRNVLAARGSEARVILVAGVQPDGSAVATNLAVALARTGAHVALLGTYAESRVGHRLGIQRRGPGLSDALERSESNGGGGGAAVGGRARPINVTLRPVPAIPGLEVILPGRDPERAAVLMQTDRGAELVASLRQASGYVVLDVPSTLTSSQAQSLAGLSDVTLLVLTRDVTERADVQDAVEQLRAVGKPPLGIVLLPPTATPRRRGRRTRAVPEPTSAVDELAEVREASSEEVPPTKRTPAAPATTAGRRVTADSNGRRRPSPAR